MDIVRQVTYEKFRKNAESFPQFSSGDTISVHVKVKEGEKERIQVFKGVVLKIQGSGMGRCFTVRKMSSGVGVERTFPFLSPAIDKIIVISRGKVRRSKLFYLRALRGRAARLTSELVHAEASSKKAKVAAPVKEPQSPVETTEEESKESSEDKK